jgi:hypothetical protein
LISNIQLLNYKPPKQVSQAEAGDEEGIKYTDLQQFFDAIQHPL